MIIKRQKSFSYLGDALKEAYSTPSPEVLKTLPRIIQQFYKSGIGTDLCDLVFMRGESESIYPFPIINLRIEEKGYRALFAADQDSADLEQYNIWCDGAGYLYKKSGIFFKSFKQITDQEFKDFLMKQLGEDMENSEELDKRIIDFEVKVLRKISNLKS